MRNYPLQRASSPTKTNIGKNLQEIPLLVFIRVSLDNGMISKLWNTFSLFTITGKNSKQNPAGNPLRSSSRWPNSLAPVILASAEHIIRTSFSRHTICRIASMHTSLTIPSSSKFTKQIRRNYSTFRILSSVKTPPLLSKKPIMKPCFPHRYQIYGRVRQLLGSRKKLLGAHALKDVYFSHQLNKQIILAKKTGKNAKNSSWFGQVS